MKQIGFVQQQVEAPSYAPDAVRFLMPATPAADANHAETMSVTELPPAPEPSAPPEPDRLHLHAGPAPSSCR
jgi:hypothetical protein